MLTEESENYVEYNVYLPIPENDIESAFLTAATKMHSLLPLDTYLWHKQEFQLYFKNGKIPHLYGRTYFGDNMDDEWFIVHVLYKISQAFDAVISVRDNDGEFLLIEAAHFIPRWLDPSNSSNRVFIYKSKLHIIPLPCESSEFKLLPTGSPALHEALDLIRNISIKTEARDLVQNQICSRIQPFESFKDYNIHRSACVLPKKAALCLAAQPKLIAAAVEAFYSRDPISERYLKKMQYFDPSETVEISVKFTRMMYAQLISQKFKPSKKYMQEVKKYDADIKKYDLGSKIACGFEILANDPIFNKKIAKSGNYENFLSKLTAFGYFDGVLQGSTKYNQLHIHAKNYWQSISVINEDHKSLSYKEIFDGILDQSVALPPKVPDDSDTWLYVDPDEFEMDLKNLLKKNDKSLSKNVKDFMSKESSVDGVDLDSDSDGEAIEEYSEREVLETIINDPDLLMKIIEQNEANGLDSESLLQKLGKISLESYESDGDDFVIDDEMDEELREKLKSHFKTVHDFGDDFGEDSVDFSVMKNLMTALDAENGMSGPASNLLKSMRKK